MRIRTTAAVATLSAATMLSATPALATPAHTTAPAAATTAASRSLNIPGLPLKANFPSTWPAFSPKSVYNSHTRTYSAGVRYLARVEGVSPATFVSRNRAVNLLGYGHATRGAIPTFTVTDLGARNITRTQFTSVLRSQGATVTGHSTVKTRFGTVYRLHYRATEHGLLFNGVVGVAHVNGHSVLVDSSSRNVGEAKSVSNTALGTLRKR